MIEHNLIFDNEQDGISVAKASFAEVSFNTISGNGRIGLQAAGASEVRSFGNVIVDNAQLAVQALSGIFRSGRFTNRNVSWVS